MNNDVEVHLNLVGINDLMRGVEVQELLSEEASAMLDRAEALKGRAGAEYSMNIRVINWIAVATVRADNEEAGLDNLENDTLLKARG